MMDREDVAAIRAAAAVVDIRGHRRVYLRSSLVDRRALADHAAIRRHTTNLKLQHAAVFECQIENFAVLSDRR
jgi:hypothetical protein